MDSFSGSDDTAVVSILLTVSLNFSRLLQGEMAENQASSQSPIFFHPIQDGNCHSQSDIEYPRILGIPVPKSLVMWVSPH